jgi:hypothetical protein
LDFLKAAAAFWFLVPLAGYAVYAVWEKVILQKKHFGYAITAAENFGYKY